ncbi:MAG: methyltransferase domain-containing protein [Gemmatimonadaceae bacterium]
MMPATALLERAINGMLAPLGVKVVRRGGPPTIGGRAMSDEAVIEQARSRGISPGALLEEMFGKTGRATEIMRRMTACGALSSRVRRVCEIGPGSGLYVEETLEAAPVSSYEIYEIALVRAQYLASAYPVTMQPTDGESLRATPDRTIDLVQAHGVFVTLDFLTSCSYFREIDRVMAPGGHVVFDIMSEECLDDAALESWLQTRLRYPSFHPKHYVVRFFTTRGYTLIDEFNVPLLVHGSSRYLIFRAPGVAA